MSRTFPSCVLVLSLAACGEGDLVADDETGAEVEASGAGASSASSETSDDSAGTGDGDGDISPLTLAIGDSVLAWNAEDGASIPDVWADLAGLQMTNAAVSGSMILSDGVSIPSQYQAGAWGRVLVDGGANDVGPDGCGCGDCLSVVDQLVSSDATQGAMVDLVDQITGDGARVVLMGYYTPVPGSEFTGCEEELAAMNARYEALAASDSMVDFVGAGEVADGSTHPEYFDEDGIHPSPQGAAVIGAYIAQRINGVG